MGFRPLERAQQPFCDGFSGSGEDNNVKASRHRLEKSNIGISTKQVVWLLLACYRSQNDFIVKKSFLRPLMVQIVTFLHVLMGRTQRLKPLIDPVA